MNIYAPNAGEDRKSFFVNVNQSFKMIETEAYTIAGGDYNCALSGDLDRQNCITNEDTGRAELKNLMNELSLEDIWRRRNPDLFDYTWNKCSGKPLGAY